MSKKQLNTSEIRNLTGLNQTEFGKRIGVTSDTVALWESKDPNRQTKPRQEHALKLLEIQREYQENIEDENKSHIEIAMEKFVKDQIEKMIIPLNEKIDKLSEHILKNELKKIKNELKKLKKIIPIKVFYYLNIFYFFHLLISFDNILRYFYFVLL